MGLFFSEKKDFSKIWHWTIVVALAFAVMGVASQTTPSTQTLTPPGVREKPELNTSPTVENIQSLDNTAGEVEIQRRFNDLRRELLDDRADTINWWLTIALIVLAVISIGAALGVYFGFGRFREIESEARKYTEEARALVKEINEQKRRAEEVGQEAKNILSDIERRHNLSLGLGDLARDDEPLSGRVRRESAPDQTQEAEEAVQEVRQIPEASPIDRAIADAYSLQRAGKIEEAIEKWRSIANVMEGIDNDLAAHAWLSVSALLSERGEEDAGDQ